MSLDTCFGVRLQRLQIEILEDERRRQASCRTVILLTPQSFKVRQSL